MDMKAQVKEKDRLSLFNLARRGPWLMRIRHMGVMRISPVVPICHAASTQRVARIKDA
jgi:hypothetical protein